MASRLQEWKKKQQKKGLTATSAVASGVAKTAETITRNAAATIQGGQKSRLQAWKEKNGYTAGTVAASADSSLEAWKINNGYTPATNDSRAIHNRNMWEKERQAREQEAQRQAQQRARQAQQWELDRTAAEVERLRDAKDAAWRSMSLTGTVEDVERVKNEYADIIDQYGGLEGVEDALRDKTVFLNRGWYEQKNAALAAVAENEDFWKLSGYAGGAEDPEFKLDGTVDLTYEFINDRNGTRNELRHKYENTGFNPDNLSALAELGYAAEVKNAVEHAYDYMNQDEVAVYNYHYATGGKDAAQEYLDSIQETLNQRKAAEVYKNFEGETALELAYGVGAGLDQFKSGMYGAAQAVTGEDDYIPASYTQMVSGAIREDLADVGFRLPEFLGGASLGQIGYDAVTTTSNMLPSILSSAAANTIAPGSGAFVGNAVMFASSSGSAYQEALNSGYDKDQARAYAALVGGSEVGLNYFLGGIGALGGKASGHVVKNALDKVDNAFARVALKLGGNAASEFTEEYLQEVLTPWFQNLTLGTDNKVELLSADALYAGLLGALTATTFEGGGTIREELGAQRAKAQTMESVDTPSQPEPGQSGTGDAYALGQLISQAGRELTPDEIQDIQEELVAEGVQEEHAAVLAEGFARAAAGGQLTEQEAAALKANDVLAEAVRNVVDVDALQAGTEIPEEPAMETAAQETRTADEEVTERWVEYLGDGVKSTQGEPVTETAATAQENQTAEDQTEEDSGWSLRFGTGHVNAGRSSDGAAVQAVDKSAENGKTVDSAPAPVSQNSGEGVTLETVSRKYGEHAGVVVSNYKQGQDVEQYDAAFRFAYDMGEKGIALSYASAAKNTAYLDQDQIRFAWRAGRSAGDYVNLQSSGKKQKVKGIAEASGGKLTLELTEGGTVDFDEVAFATEGGAQVYDAIRELSENTAEARQLLLAWRNGSLSGQAFADGVRKAYRMGESGVGTQQLQLEKGWVAELGQEVRELAYGMGRKKATARTKARQAELRKRKKETRQEGRVHFDGDRSKLTQRQKVSINALEAVAEAMGIQIYVFESGTDAEGRRVGANGWYDTKTGDIHIDLHAGLSGEGTMLFTAAHELTHFIKAWSPEKFQVLADFLMEQYGEKGVSVEDLIEQQQLKAQRGGRELSYEDAFEEMVADSMETMLSDGKVVERLAALRRRDQSVWEKLREGLDGLVKKIRGAYRGMKPDSPEGRQVARMKDAAERLQELFAQALEDAGGNYRGAEKNTAQEGDGVKYQLREYSQQQKDNWKTSKRIVVYESEAQLHQFILDSMENKTMDKKMYLGAVPENLAAEIKAETGLDVEGFNLSLGSYEIRKITKDHGNEAKEATRGQRAVAADDFAHIADIVQNPQKITLSDMLYSGKPAIIFSGEYNGRMNVVAVVSDKRMDLFVQTVYVNVKKGNLATPTGDQAPVNTPEASSGTVSSAFSIDEGQRNVNTKYSDRDPEMQRINELLEKENKAQKEEIGYLQELLQLQRKVTNGTRFSRSSVRELAGMLMKEVEAKGDRNELANILNDLYEHIATIDDPLGITWADIDDRIDRATEWIMDHVKVKQVRGEYADSILRELRTMRIRLNEGQMAEVASRYGSYNGFRKATFGSFILSKEGMPLDEVWQDLAARYPETFDAEIGDADMPLKLVEIVDDLRDTDLAAAEFEAKRAGMAEDLRQKVYDGYFKLSRLKTVADEWKGRMEKANAELRAELQDEAAVIQRQMDRIALGHEDASGRITSAREEMDALERERSQLLRQLRREKRMAVEDAQKETAKRYQDSRKRAVEGRRKTARRHQIERTVKRLEQLLVRGDKKKHVKEGMRDLVAQALASANVLFAGSYSDEELVLAGVGVTVEPEESRLLDETRHLMAVRKDLFAKLSLTDEQRIKQSERLDRKIAANMKELGGVLRRERIRLNDATVTQVLNDLATAYKSLEKSDDLYLRGAVSEEVYQHLLELGEKIGGATAGDLSLDQLEEVSRAFTMVLTTVRNANKLFDQQQKQNVAGAAGAVTEEVAAFEKSGELGLEAFEKLKGFGINNLKPVYFFELLGSETMQRLFDNVRAGEDTWARDVTQAKEFLLEMRKKHGVDSWDMEKRHSFMSASGKEFHLDLQQIMSLYAYSRRADARDHIRKGGIKIDESTKVTVKTKLGLKMKFNPTKATAYSITDETLDEIVGKLTKEQRAFAEEMQAYLSDTMGAKGNEVSMQMYGVKLFNEKFYFPLKSAPEYMEKAKEQQGQDRKLKNAGFTKSTQTGASNTIVLTGFMDVWADHVNDMSMYHAFTLPLEDFYRVYNYGRRGDGNMDAASVNAAIQNAFGKGATGYIDQLLKDLNGSARVDSTAGVINQMMGLFKKGAVFASASVVIQQPSAIARALAMVDAKYFIGRRMDKKRRAQVWEEVKRYAPVAIIKEMGYFDTSMGKSTRDFLTGQEYEGWTEKAWALVRDSDYRDEVLSRGAALADELTWCSIWEAVKRETNAKNPRMRVTSQEFLELAGKRFTEVITKTQVYDSVLSRSAMMRSKDSGMKMATAFMGEPTTAINMVADALIQGKRGNKRYARRAIGAVLASNILNAALVSLVYAARDDDEDKEYWEKYLGSVTGEIFDSMNPLTYIPFVKDVVSIAQGYEVERSDMAIISDLYSAYQKLNSENATDWEKTEAVLGSVTALFGLPVKNILRDARAVYNVYQEATDGVESTAVGIGYAVKEALPKWLGGQVVTNGQQLYEAYLAGDQAHIDRVTARYKDKGGNVDEKAARAALRKALRESDPRIREAAKAWNADDLDTYMRIAKKIIGEKHFTQDDVVAAIRAEASSLLEDGGSAASGTTHQALFSSRHFAIAAADGDEEMMSAIKADLILTAQSNGKTEERALSSFISSARSSLKESYVGGEMTEKRLMEALTGYCDMSEKEAEEQVLEWKCEKDTGIALADTQEAFVSGEVSEEEARQMLEEYGGYAAKDAESKVLEWKCEKDTGIAYADIQQLYVDGEMDEEEARELRVTYGESSIEDARKTVLKWQCEKDNDVKYADIDTAYLSGDITEQQAVEWLMKYGEKEQEDAELAVQAYAWRDRNREYSDLSDSKIDRYIDWCEPAGVDVATFYEAQAAVAGFTGSKKQQYVDYILSLDLSWT